MLSVVIFYLIFSVVSSQSAISCNDLLNNLLECANEQGTSEEVVAIPVTCIDSAGASIEDLQICGLIDIAPAPEEEYIYGEEEGEETTEDVGEPVTLVISDTKKTSKPVKSTKKVRVEVVRKPKIYTKKVVVQPKPRRNPKPAPIPNPVPVPVPVPNPVPVPVPVPPIYGSASAQAAAVATAQVAGGSSTAAAQAAALADILS